MSACCSSRSRATSSSSQGTTVTATPPTGSTAPPGSADKGAEHRREEPQAVGAPARSGRVPAGVAEHDPPLRLELVEGGLVGDELPVLVLQRDGDPLADGVLPVSYTHLTLPTK